MKKIIALFPNLIFENTLSIWDIKINGINLQVLATISVVNSDGEKAVMRKLKIFKSHLMLAAYLEKVDPIIFCKVVVLNSEEENFDIPVESKSKIPLSRLIKYLPRDPKNTAVTVSWFANYLEQPYDDERARIFRLYNAFGTLPTGFNNILATVKTYEDKKLLEKMLNRIKDFHKADTEDESYVYKTAFMSDEEIKYIEKLYISHLKDLYPCFG